jgi:hypothetical protein
VGCGLWVVGLWGCGVRVVGWNRAALRKELVSLRDKFAVPKDGGWEETFEELKGTIDAWVGPPCKILIGQCFIGLTDPQG